MKDNLIIDDQYTYLLTDDCSDDNNQMLSTQVQDETGKIDYKKNKTIYGNYILSPIPFCTNRKLTKEQKYSNILSPIPFCTNSVTEKIQFKNILSPIPTCTTKSTKKGL